MNLSPMFSKGLPLNIVEYRAKVNRLFAYARKFAEKAEAAGRGTQYPTFRQAANAMKCTYDELEQLIADYDGEGYLGAGVGMQVGGLGGGTYSFKYRSQYVVEAYL